MKPRELWDKYLVHYDYLCDVGSYMQSMRDVAAACGDLAGQRILDAGSGTGNLSIMLKAGGAIVTSCDYSDAGLAVHRSKDPSAHLVRLSLEEPLPFESASFDGVCCTSVLFSLSREGCALALREFERVLKPDGKLIVTVAAPSKKNGNLLKAHVLNTTRKEGLARGLYKVGVDLPRIGRLMLYNNRLQKLPDWQGYHRFSQDELENFLREAGFDDLAFTKTYGGAFIMSIGCKKVTTICVK